MKIIISLISLLWLLWLMHVPQSDESHTVVLTHVAVIDTAKGSIRNGMTVVIEGNHITAVGPDAKAHLPENAKVIDARGKFLIPGLWDMHAHLFGKEYLKLFAANGVT